MELLALLSNNEKLILAVDTDSLALSEQREFLERFDDGMALIITHEDTGSHVQSLPDSVIGHISEKATPDEFLNAVDVALEKQKLKRRLELLKHSDRTVASSYDQGFHSEKPDRSTGFIEPLTAGKLVNEKIIVNFARMLTASFDMRKLLETFMDSVMEIARVSRMSVLLKNKQGFYVKTQHGLDPYIADNIIISRDSALASWLAKTGRIIHKPLSFIDNSAVDIKSDMEALQCMVSFPMMYKGKLIGIFNIDSKVTEDPFHKEELEMIYVLCNYLGAAVKDIDVYHQMWYQKEFTKNILLSMNSGMVAIDKDEKITFFNNQASEILHIDSERMSGKDVRALPYPLGDILLRTMVAGTSYNRHEVEMGRGGLFLGINSYRLQDEHQVPTGAGIIFSDISDSKKLAEQNNRSARLDAVNNLVAKIAHEVRNPLTSIQTYIQLLSDKLTDDDLNNFYLSTVKDSINKLTGLIDKLVTFSSSQNYNMKYYDISVFINDSFDFLSKNLPMSHRLSRIVIDKPLFINVDKRQMIKAIYYLISSIIDMTPEGNLIRLGTYGTKPDDHFVEISIEFSNTGKAIKDKKALLKPLLDIEHLGTELNIPISHKIIEAHDGSLDIRSFDNINSFIIKLPLVENKNVQVPSEGGRASGQ